MSRRSRIVGFGSAGVLVGLVVLGIVCAFAFSGGLGQNLAFTLVALGLVLGTALVFYEVGLTEDKDRAREDRKRAREQKAPASQEREAAAKREHPPERATRTRLGRSRGRPRRLR